MMDMNMDMNMNVGRDGVKRYFVGDAKMQKRQSVGASFIRAKGTLKAK